MSDNRGLNSKFIPFSTSINYTYSKKHGYDFIYYQPYLSNPEELNVLNCVDFESGALKHASWSKLISTLLAMNTNKYDYVVYIDSDCIFKNQEKKIEKIIELTDKNIIFFSNAPYSPTMPCAGFYICKVNEDTKQYIKDWYNYNIPEKNIAHSWEQAALWKMNRFDEIYIVNEVQFVEKEGQLIRHIGHQYDSKREKYFRIYALQNNILIETSNINKIKYDTNTCKDLFSISKVDAETNKKTGPFQ